MKKDVKYRRRRLIMLAVLVLIALSATIIGMYKCSDFSRISYLSETKDRKEHKRMSKIDVPKDRHVLDKNIVNKPSTPSAPQPANTSSNNVTQIPVLMYHSIGNTPGNDLVIRPEVLEGQLKYLKENNFNTINLKDLYDYFSTGKQLPANPIVLTFDDGYENNYTLGYPLFKKYNVKANIFVITSWLDHDKNILTSSQIKEMDKNGVEIESHTFNHDELNKLTYAKQVDTLKKSKDFLEKLLNRPVMFIAYPFGHYNEDTIRAAADTGYKMAFLTKYGFAQASEGLLKLDRVRISAGDSIRVYGSKIRKVKRQ